MKKNITNRSKDLVYFLLCSVLVSTFFSILVSPTQALTPLESSLLNNTQETQVQLTAIPARLGEDFSLTSKPGETIQTVVRVKNGSNQVQTVQTIVEDFILGEDGKEPLPVKEATSNQWSLARWITIDPSPNTLQPNELATLNVLIQVPQDALPGGRYAMIMHEPTSLQPTSNMTGAGISQRVGTLLYFIVEGDIHQEAYIRNVQAKQFFEYGPVPFSFKMENRSDIHIRPNIQVEIRQITGGLVDTIVIDPQNVFPGTERLYESTWKRKWGLGKYTATIIANYGDQGNVVREVFSFWMFPLRLVLVVVFIIALITGIVLFLRRKIDASIKEKTQEKEILTQKVKNLGSEKLHHFKDEQN